MEYGFVKTAAVSPKIRVADPVYNGTEIIRLMKETWEKGARIIVFPELCITGYTCSDLFRQELLLKTAKEGDRGSQRRNGWSVLCRTSPGESRKAL